jgi:hypothetical protein
MILLSSGKRSPSFGCPKTLRTALKNVIICQNYRFLLQGQTQISPNGTQSNPASQNLKILKNIPLLSPE